MGIDFRGIRRHLQRRLERLRVRAALALLNLIKAIVVKLGSQDQKKEFAAEWETHDQLDFADFFPPASDAGPKDRRFCDDAHGLFDGSCSASKGAERRPSFFPE